MRTIQYRVPIEKMITRLPGLFAYLGEDGYGNIVLHKATESLNGCYGKIVENIVLPDNVNLEYDGVKLNEGGVYSFRTLITYYYMFKDNLEATDPFRLFIEKGIGKIKVDTSKFKKGVATPEYVYLSNVRQLYNQLVKMSRQCKLYQQHVSNDVNLCCICEKYENMGGDGFKDYIYSLISEAEEIANEYYGYADEVKNNHLTLDFDIDIMCSEKDYGLMSSYMPQWLPYKRYYVGDKVYYDGKIWICTAETTGRFDDKEHRVVFDEKSFEEYSYSIDNDVSKDTINGQTDSKLCDLRRIATYRNEDNEAEVPESGYDWLFYYRKGNVVNVNTLTDEDGNILSYEKAKDGIMAAAEKGDDLLAYGDVITDITLNTSERTIEFKYVQGVRLKCNKKEIDGEKIIWRNLERLETSDEGISYTEIYTYNEGSDLENFIKGTDETYVFSNGMYVHNESSEVITSSEFEELPYYERDNYTLIEYNFEDYISGKCDIALKNYKFEFVTSNNTITHEKVIGNQEANIVSILTDFNIYRKNNYDNYMNSENIRYDFYNGISYSPSVKHDVNINRGSTAVFQKHIALSEIKTLNDLTEYKNGSFFKISKT